MIGDHDHLLVVGQVNADDRVRGRDQNPQPSKPGVAVAMALLH
jgi:hypothetical protein